MSTPAIACSGSYLPHLLRVLRRLVHPDEQRDGVSNGANVGKLVKISGPGDYYSDEEEEYPYREDSGSECEGEDEEQDADFAAGEEDDQFEDEEAPGYRPGIWKRTDDDAKSEYTSWSKRTASSYLPPERRMQLWRDIDDFGLPDDGYDYTQHLRNPGAGVRLDACYSQDTVNFLEKKEKMEQAQLDKQTKEVLTTLELLDSDDEAAPALEGDEEAALRAWAEEGKQKIETSEVVEEGDMDDLFVKMMGESDDEEDADPLLSQPRDLRLLDEQFNAFLSAYDDDKIGELSEDVGPARPFGAPQEDEAYYRDLLQSYINGTATLPGVKLVPRGAEEEEEEEEEEATPAGFVPLDDGFDENDLNEITAKTKALGLAQCEKSDGDSDDSFEDVELVGKVQWDCESIVSTYSNIYNHPKQIADSRKAVKIVINKATGLPHIEGSEDTEGNGRGGGGRRGGSLPAGLTSQEEGEGDGEGTDSDDGKDAPSVCPSSKLLELGARQKLESAEDKKARKEAAKELKALAREKKSARKALFKMAANTGVKVSAADPRTKNGLSIQRYA